MFTFIAWCYDKRKNNSMNKYERKPDYIVDLHRYTTREAGELLDEIIGQRQYNHIRIITGKGTFRETGPVLRTFVQNYLKSRDIPFSTSKISDGGEGALEVFLG
jgi:DNA-nicking Smr family endonuclease